METILSPKLDRIEEKLPELPRQIFKLQRAVAMAGYAIVKKATSASCSATSAVAERASTGARTVAGQAESVAARVQSAAASGVREVRGQARYQIADTVDTLESEAVNLIDSATAQVEAITEAAYAEWTKADLYDRAQDLDIAGRSTMTKAELVAALQAS